jgi:hypothetical protein
MGNQIKDPSTIIQQINADTVNFRGIEDFVNCAAKYLIKIQTAADDFGYGI